MAVLETTVPRVTAGVGLAGWAGTSSQSLAVALGVWIWEAREVFSQAGSRLVLFTLC